MRLDANRLFTHSRSEGVPSPLATRSPRRANTPGARPRWSSGLYDVRLRDLVVPALLVGIEGDPDDPDSENEEGDEEGRDRQKRALDDLGKKLV